MGLSDRACFLRTRAAVPLGLRLIGLSWAKVGAELGVLLVVKSQWEWRMGGWHRNFGVWSLPCPWMLVSLTSEQPQTLNGSWNLPIR